MEICVLQNPIKVNWPKRSGRESGNHAYFFWLRGKITWRQKEPQTISFINASAVQRQAEEHTLGCCSYILLLANPALHWHLTKKYWNPSGALEVNHFTKVNNTDIPASVWTTIPIAEIWPQRVPSIRVKLARKSRITTHNRYNTKIPACGQIFVSINHAGRLIVCHRATGHWENNPATTFRWIKILPLMQSLPGTEIMFSWVANLLNLTVRQDCLAKPPAINMQDWPRKAFKSYILKIYLSKAPVDELERHCSF